MHQRLNEKAVHSMGTTNHPHHLDTFQLEIPASYEALPLIEENVQKILSKARHAAGSVRHETLDEGHNAYKIWLAVHETCTNIIEHAYSGQPGTIRIVFSLDEHPLQVVIDLYDSGRAFNPTGIPEPDLGQAQTSGYGLFIINELMDKVVYETSSGQNHWQLRKTLAGNI